MSLQQGSGSSIEGDERLSLEDAVDVDADERLSLGVCSDVLGVDVIEQLSLGVSSDVPDVDADEGLSLDVLPDSELDTESTKKHRSSQTLVQ